MHYASNDDLPMAVRQVLPRDAQDVFRAAANEAEDGHSALVAGWAEVEKGWRKPDKRGAKWVKKPKEKNMPGPSDVHVPTTERDRKKPKDNAMKSEDNFATGAEVIKVDESLGLVFGWAIICTKDGEPYFDKNIDAETHEPSPDHIPEDEMLKASVDFMMSDRIAGDMHKRNDEGEPVRDGIVVFMMPMTSDIAKAYGIETNTTGLMIAAKPSPDVLEKFKSGEYTGFSIGGKATREAVEAA